MIRAKTFQDLFKRYRRPGDLVFAVVFFAFSLFLLATIGGQVTWGGGKGMLSQPAFAPWVAVLSMVVFSALHLASSLVSPKLEGRWTEVAFWLRALEFVVWFLVYVMIVPRLGYLISTILLALLLSLRLGYRGRVMLGSAAVFALGVVLIFKTFLQVKVPGGAIYEALPTGLRAFMLTYF